MAKKVYRTARGTNLDLGALQLQHEKTAAIGNMRVNARGDEITPDGRVITNRQDSVNEKYYDLHTMVPQEDEIIESSVSKSKAPEADVDDSFENLLMDVTPAEPAVVKAPSLSDSVATLQSKTSTEIKAPREQKKSISGVKRI